MTQEFDLGYIRGAAGAQGPTGPAGATGAQGPAGATPSISIGQVVAVEPGEAAYVTRRAGSPDLSPILDFGLPTAAGDMSAAVYDPDARHQDIFAYCDARSGRRGATRVVAAADSEDADRADFYCDGTADQVTINRAIASLPETGGRVLLLEGSYLLDCYATEPDAAGRLSLITVTGDNVTISGQGRSTRLMLTDGAAESGDISLLSVSGSGFLASAFVLDGNDQNNSGAAVTGLELTDYAADACLSRILVQNCAESGVSSNSGDASLLDCAAQDCGTGFVLGGRSQVRFCRLNGNGHGIYIDGGQHLISGCSLFDNLESGVSGQDGQRCRVSDNSIWGQPLGISLRACSDCWITGNLIFRAAGATPDWVSGEMPIRLINCTRPHAVGNYVRGKAIQLYTCIDAVLSYSGYDWNPTA